MSPWVKFALAALILAPALAVAARFAPSGHRSLPDDLPSLAALAVSADQSTAYAAIARLRAAGPEGLAVLLERLPTEPDSNQLAPVQATADEARVDDETLRLRRAIDGVAAQRDAWASRLYWHTDLESALAVARATNRPVLALHLLGRLSDELSCANSRFFRQVLYCDPAVGKLLRERFVLYWHSVRAVPVATIDFGDGRKLVRTITGNSIHYVLDREGRLVDALPGMYAPGEFHDVLARAEALARETVALDDAARREALASFHGQAMSRLNEALRAKLQQAAIDPNSPRVVRLALGLPSIDDLAVLDTALWEQLAATDPRPSELSPAASRFVREGTPQAVAAGRTALSKLSAEFPLLRAVAQFETTLRADTLRNELVLHRLLHNWLIATAPATREELADFNERVYAGLFLAPLDDPWAGLLNPGVYDGLGNAALTAPEDSGD